MAVWQCDFHLVPEAQLVGSAGKLPLRISEAEFEDTLWWAGVQPPADYPVLLSTLLPMLSDDLEYRQWGTEDGNRVDIFLEQDRVTAIWVRIDMREPKVDVIEGLLEFARHCGAMLIDETFAVVPPERAEIALVLQHSRAARFLSDPEWYLQRLSIGGIEDA